MLVVELLVPDEHDDSTSKTMIRTTNMLQIPPRCVYRLLRHASSGVLAVPNTSSSVAEKTQQVPTCVSMTHKSADPSTDFQYGRYSASQRLMLKTLYEEYMWSG